MIAWLAPVFVFGLVVLVHELGHFLAAKLTGVYAPRFSIGWGRPIVGKRFGETEYVLSWLPLGGYVRMASREDESLAFIEGGGEQTAPAEPRARRGDWDPDAMLPFGPRPIPASRWFESKPVAVRVFILVAGVSMNALLALVVNIAALAGYGVADPATGPAVVDSVLPGRPAAVAGLRGGDSIVAVDGRRVDRWGELVAAVAPAPGRTLTLEVRRTGQPLALTVRPALSVERNPATGTPDSVGRIGAVARRQRLGLADAVVGGARLTWRMGTLILGEVSKIFTGRVPLTQLGGPVAIGRASIDAARTGAEALLSLLAFISINVAVLNLLPVPFLDGGNILLNIAEAVKGGPLNPRLREQIMRVGVVFIVALLVLVMYNDVIAPLVRGVTRRAG